VVAETNVYNSHSVSNANRISASKETFSGTNEGLNEVNLQ